MLDSAENNVLIGASIFGLFAGIIAAFVTHRNAQRNNSLSSSDTAMLKSLGRSLINFHLSRAGIVIGFFIIMAVYLAVTDSGSQAEARGVLLMFMPGLIAYYVVRRVLDRRTIRQQIT